MFEGKVQPVRALMVETRKSNPMATIMYHEMSDQVGQGRRFGKAW
jgi:hypothetical protein